MHVFIIVLDIFWYLIMFCLVLRLHNLFGTLSCGSFYRFLSKGQNQFHFTNGSVKDLQTQQLVKKSM